MTDTELNLNQKEDDQYGSEIISIGNNLANPSEVIELEVNQLWSITPGNYPYPHENIRECAGVRFTGHLIMTNEYEKGNIDIYQLNNMQLGSHILHIKKDNPLESKAIYCNSVNATCYISNLYGISYHHEYKRKFLEINESLATNLNKALLQQSDQPLDEEKELMMEWGADIFPNLTIKAINNTYREHHGYTEYSGRMFGIGEYSIKRLKVNLEDELIKPELEKEHNIIKIKVDEIDAYRFLEKAIADVDLLKVMIEAMKKKNRSKFSFITYSMDFFAVFVELNLVDEVTISKFIMAPNLVDLENYIYADYDVDQLGQQFI